MQVKVIMPNRVFFDGKAEKISAPGTSGAFQILPNHTDVIWSLDSGILIIESDGREYYFAIDDGMLVKEGREVAIASFNIIQGDSLEVLSDKVLQDIREMNESEREAREALAKLEVETVRRFGEL